MNVFHNFHAKGKFERSLNGTFIALIPKKLGSVDIKDFRPISLVGEVYKIVAKILANRSKMVVEKIISKPHNKFIRGMQILHSVLTASGCLESSIKSREISGPCKLDIEKIYDHANGDFFVVYAEEVRFWGKIV